MRNFIKNFMITGAVATISAGVAGIGTKILTTLSCYSSSSAKTPEADNIDVNSISNSVTKYLNTEESTKQVNQIDMANYGVCSLVGDTFGFIVGTGVGITATAATFVGLSMYDSCYKIHAE